MVTIPKTYSNSRDFDEWIHVKFEFEGYHRWKDAPEQVAFLRNWHRHIFKCKASIMVEHDDRELEFIMVKRVIADEIVPYMEMSEQISSCEQKAKYIANALIDIYGNQRRYAVTVEEDGENGSTVIWPKLS